MKIVVIGGSGRVGGNVVRRLVAQGHEAVPASPATGVDTITGEGLADVLAGADAVVDVSNAPVWDDGAVREFFEFLPQIAEAGAEGNSVRLSNGLMQLVAADDVAATVAELATGAPAGGRIELGGPEALGIDAWARRLFAATGDARTVVSDPHARYFGTELKGGELTPGDGARVGTTDFDTWFATQPQGAAR
jgi:uncharacterized protein YbjT (DUF2867 family)